MKLKRLTSLLLATFVFASVPVLAEETPMAKDGEMAKALINQAATFILRNYKFEISRDELYKETLMKIMEAHPEITEEAFKAMFSSLDEHSTYYTQEEYDYFIEDMSGEFCGIGVVITALDNGLLVTSVQADTPAFEQGMQSGDVIISADGVDIRGMSMEKARAYIIGESGTSVKVGVLRDGETLEFTIIRRPVVLEPGWYQAVDEKIGYIRLDTFDGSAPELVNHALDFFDSKGITDIIFDLRSNPGGAVDAFVDVCQRIIPEGPVIHFEYKSQFNFSTFNSECKNPKYRVIALTDGNSASASEAFCGAVQDSGIGIVVGDTTYGKGTMQNLTDFKTGGGVKLTTAEYLTRNKRKINGKGIVPDKYVKDSTTTLQKSGFADLDFENKLTVGDKGENVLALNQRLWALGYDVGLPTDTFTEDTKIAVFSFQKKVGLYPYGVCDISTQLKLEDTLQDYEIPDNMPFKEAVQIFKENKVERYRKVHE